ncbi:TniQ family protein [Rhodobacter sp. 24-YEA-8]|uniref:TniQ family protein n=1 Tax=Rhodobacter sp. 24-YEA-8 TaxID=1884310 RepID=UPI00344CF256
MPVPRETLPSFLSRFAAMNGSTLANFSSDLGYDHRRFLNFDGEPIDMLMKAAGLSLSQVEDMISWTGRAVGDV